MPKTKILSGKEVSEAVYDNLQPRISKLKNKGITPGLAVILVGDDPASQVYVRSKGRKFNKLDLFSETIVLPSDIDENSLISKIHELNNDNQFHGILVQLPLPKHLDSNKILFEMNPNKDVDGFHPVNIGKLASGEPQCIPCTPKGVMRIFEHYNIELSGKHVVVLGRSNIAGRPLSILTSLKTNYANATTTICHSGTPDIPKIAKQADVLIAAIGVPEMIDETFVKPGAVVIDVGINRVEDDSEKGYKLVGDVNFESVSGISSAITPVPGGVGMMTIAMLVENTVEAAESIKNVTKAKSKKLSFFEQYLTIWVLLCIVAGILIGKNAPNFAIALNDFSIYQVSIPIAICLFFMMYPIMVKIDFTQVMKSAKTPKPVLMTLIINWGIKPFTMYAIAYFFLGYLFKQFIPGTEILPNGQEVELWRSYVSGAILLGIAPCTAMVLMWGYLAKGNDGLTLVMVAINSLLMLVLYGLLGGFLLNINAMPIPWQTMLLSVAIYVALPLVAGYISRKTIIKYKGIKWFNEEFLHWLTPVSIVALLVTLILLFSLKGDVILDNPLTIFWIAIPLFIQTILIFVIGYFGFARLLKLSYQDAAPAAMIGASNHFEVAIATAIILFGLSSGAALATVVGVLIEVPTMLMLVAICKRTSYLFTD